MRARGRSSVCTPCIGRDLLAALRSLAASAERIGELKRQVERLASATGQRPSQPRFGRTPPSRGAMLVIE
eukprot:5909428-Pyramimonas_sp.AAC.1